MFGKIFKNSFTMLGKKPFLLIGLSLLTALLNALAVIFCGPFFALSLAFCLVLNVGMASVFLAGYKKESFSSENLFVGFKNFGKTSAGMAWKVLWVFIWSLIPIAGFVMAIIKKYEYAFVPYILKNDNSVTATQALKKSQELTKGHKGLMFCADLTFLGITAAIIILCVILNFIPVLGIILNSIILIIYFILLPFLKGLVYAGFYNEIVENKAETAQAVEN